VGKGSLSHFFYFTPAGNNCTLGEKFAGDVYIVNKLSTQDKYDKSRLSTYRGFSLTQTNSERVRVNAFNR